MHRGEIELTEGNVSEHVCDGDWGDDGYDANK